MLVAVAPYRGSLYYESNKILLADMKAGSVRYYTEQELVDLNAEVHNLFHKGDMYGTSAQSFETSIQLTANFKFRLGYFNGVRDKEYRLYGVAVHIKYDLGSTYFEVNDNAIVCDFFISELRLAYAFKYKDYIVLRLRFILSGTSNIVWMTVVLDSKGEIQGYWDEDLDVCTDKTLATRIDMISDY